MTSPLGSRSWTRERLGKYSARFILGDRTELPEGAIVSVTYGERMKLWQIVINGLFNQLVMRGLRRNPALYYGELFGNFDDFAQNRNVTLTVWEGRDMVEFRDTGSHGIAKRFLGWVLWGHEDGAYFLTWKPTDARIPTAEEAMALAKQYGKHVVRGKVVRTASKPETALSRSA